MVPEISFNFIWFFNRFSLLLWQSLILWSRCRFVSTSDLWVSAWYQFSCSVSGLACWFPFASTQFVVLFLDFYLLFAFIFVLWIRLHLQPITFMILSSLFWMKLVQLWLLLRLLLMNPITSLGANQWKCRSAARTKSHLSLVRLLSQIIP